MRLTSTVYVLLVASAVLLSTVTDASARRGRQRADTGAAPAASLPPGSLSARLNRFLDRHLERSILAPLTRRTRLPRQELSRLLLDLNARLAVAGEADRPALVEAVALGNVLSAIMDERESRLRVESVPAPMPASAPGGMAAPPADLRAASTTEPLSGSRRARTQARREERAARKQVVAQREQEWAANCSRHRQSIYEISAKLAAAETHSEPPRLPTRAGIGGSLPGMTPQPASLVPRVAPAGARPRPVTTTLPPAPPPGTEEPPAAPEPARP